MADLLDKDYKTAALKLLKKITGRCRQKKQCMNKIGISIKFNRWYLVLYLLSVLCPESKYKIPLPTQQAVAIVVTKFFVS